LHNNSIIFKSSWNLVCISEIFPPEICIVESSAYISVLQFEICQIALVNIIDKWIEEINNGNDNVVILLDLKKAFDVVDHDIIAKTLEIYG
jgi:hypothetical protein